MLVVDSAAQKFQLSGGIAKDDWDKWSEARDRQSALASADAAAETKNPLYGWDDLTTYGEWIQLPNGEFGWAPYEPVGWSPYAAGTWRAYRDWGPTWISDEPWGWLPFHYGAWKLDPSFGWFWTPGTLTNWSPALIPAAPLGAFHRSPALVPEAAPLRWRRFRCLDRRSLGLSVHHTRRGAFEPAHGSRDRAGRARSCSGRSRCAWRWGQRWAADSPPRRSPSAPPHRQAHQRMEKLRGFSLTHRKVPTMEIPRPGARPLTA